MGKEVVNVAGIHAVVMGIYAVEVHVVEFYVVKCYLLQSRCSREVLFLCARSIRKIAPVGAFRCFAAFFCSFPGRFLRETGSLKIRASTIFKDPVSLDNL